MSVEGELLWSPRPQFAAASNMARYLQWLRRTGRGDFADYAALWRWSVGDLEAFWASIWCYFDVHSLEPYQRVVHSLCMPGSRWFEGSRVNYAEHLLRGCDLGRSDRVAIHHLSELRPLSTVTWSELGRDVRQFARCLRALGVRKGDRVVACLPTGPEAAIAMIATIAIGAVWASAAPEFGVRTIVDRFAQVGPRVLLAADGYRFAGKDFARARQMQEVAGELPTLERVIWLRYLDLEAPPPAGLPECLEWGEALQGAGLDLDHDAADFAFEYVECDHPLWIVFSSGTTGPPKAIAHSHVGALVEHYKLMAFHLNLTPDSTMCFYTTTGWMMWNLLVAALLQGSAIVLYDGSPTHPQPDFLWELAARTGATNMGASPTFVQLMEKAGLRPGETHDLSRLDSILVAGAPSTPETFSWFYRCVKRDLWVTSQSGGTELCSAFVGAAPILPVYAGEIQARSLGMDVHAWNEDGEELIDEVGELVVTKPFPSMPIRFWNDRDGQRYRDSYFSTYAGVWRHGDFIKINARGGCYIYGRSDATLNRHGVRIGTAEIYRVVERIDGVADSLIVCCELPGGRFFMPLFVRPKLGRRLDAAMRDAIVGRLRDECSPRHLPDRIYEVEKIPYTLTGKKLEVPVRKILMGHAPDKAASRDSLADATALDEFVRFARESTDYDWRSPGAMAGLP